KSDRHLVRAMSKRRERPIPRVNPSGEKVWVARPTDANGKRHHRGTFRLKREAPPTTSGRTRRPSATRSVGTRPTGRHAIHAPSAPTTTGQQAPAGARRRDRGPQAGRLAIRGAPPQPRARTRGPHAQASGPRRGWGDRDPARSVSDGRGRDRRP